MTGCDSISSFFGKGKKGVWKNVLTNKGEGISLLKDLTIDSMRQFTIQFIYNDNTSSNLTEMREKKWRLMKRKCFSRSGIDEDSHETRFARVRYVVNLIESFESKYERENPLTNGYMLDENLNCVPIRYTKPAMPDNIIILQNDAPEATSRHSDSDDESEGSGDKGDVDDKDV